MLRCRNRKNPKSIIERLETGVLFIAPDMALNCPAATPGTWGGETINPLWGNPVSLPERGMPGCHSKGAGNEVKQITGIIKDRGHLPGRF